MKCDEINRFTYIYVTRNENSIIFILQKFSTFSDIFDNIYISVYLMISWYCTSVRLVFWICPLSVIRPLSPKDFQVNFYLRQTWVDPRLKFDPVNGVDKIDASYGSMVSNVWMPDVFFRNEKSASFHKITQPNHMVTIKSDGTVWLVSK